jgi:hypothetical protein
MLGRREQLGDALSQARDDPPVLLVRIALLVEPSLCVMVSKYMSQASLIGSGAGGRTLSPNPTLLITHRPTSPQFATDEDVHSKRNHSESAEHL